MKKGLDRGEEDDVKKDKMERVFKLLSSYQLGSSSSQRGALYAYVVMRKMDNVLDTKERGFGWR